MVLAPGANTLPAEFHLAPPSPQVRDAFLSGYVAGQEFLLDISGSESSTTVDSLKLALASVKMSSTIKGITDKLIAPGSKAFPDLGQILALLVAKDTMETPVQVMIYNPFDTPLYIKSMNAVTKYKVGPNLKIFGTVNADVGMEIGAKQTVLSKAVTMVSDKRVDGFITTLLAFIAANPTLVFGPKDVDFHIEATIVAQVGGSSGYLGNVQYVQDPTTINVKLNGKPEEVQAFLNRDKVTTTTTAAQPTSTSTGTETTIAGSTTEAPTTEAPTTTVAPTTTETPKAETTTTSATIVKRQDVTIPSGDLSEDLIKAALNKLFTESGQPALFPAA